jgi:hypothetical protein
VNGSGSAESDAPRSPERFRHAKDRADISGILQARKHDDWRAQIFKEIIQAPFPWPDQCDDALRMFRILDSLERT